MAIQQATFAPPKKEVGKKGRKSGAAKGLGDGLGVIGGIAGAISGGIAGFAGGGPIGAGAGAISGGIGGAQSGRSLGQTIGRAIDPDRPDTRRVEFGQVQTAPQLDSQKLGFNPSKRSTMISEALAALQTQPPELQTAYAEPLSVGLISSLAVDKQTYLSPAPTGVA